MYPERGERFLEGTTAAPAPHIQRMALEKFELQERLDKLQRFFGTRSYKELELEDQLLLRDQRMVMELYLNILKRRMARAGERGELLPPVRPGQAHASQGP